MASLFLDRKKQREEDIMLKNLMVHESRKNLVEAALSTTLAANSLIRTLKSKLQDRDSQIENTARILNDALVICDEATGSIQSFNPAAEDLFGYKFAEVKDIFIGELISKANSEHIWDFLKADLHNHIGRTKNGGVISLSINHAMLNRSDGTSIVLLVLRDNLVSEKYPSISQTNVDSIFIIKDEKIVAANPAATRLFGFNTAELLTKPIESMVKHKRTITNFYEGGVVIEICEGLHSSGTKLDLFCISAMIWWHGEKAALLSIKNIPSSEIQNIPSAEIIKLS